MRTTGLVIIVNCLNLNHYLKIMLYKYVVFVSDSFRLFVFVHSFIAAEHDMSTVRVAVKNCVTKFLLSFNGWEYGWWDIQRIVVCIVLHCTCTYKICC